MIFIRSVFPTTGRAELKWPYSAKRQLVLTFVPGSPPASIYSYPPPLLAGTFSPVNHQNNTQSPNMKASFISLAVAVIVPAVSATAFAQQSAEDMYVDAICVLCVRAES